MYVTLPQNTVNIDFYAHGDISLPDGTSFENADISRHQLLMLLTKLLFSLRPYTRKMS